MLAYIHRALIALVLVAAQGCDVEFVVGCPTGTCTASPAATQECEDEDKIPVCTGNLIAAACNPLLNQACWPCVMCDEVNCVAPLCEEVGSDGGAANAAAEALLACMPDAGT